MHALTRRRWMQAAGMSALGLSASGWLPALAHQLADDPRRKRHCILLWMTGGPSQLDTFDLKPGHANGGEFQEIATNVPGVRISEHLPQLAGWADQMAIVRGLSTREGDHGRGTHLMRTGHAPMGNVRYPSIGASLSKELADRQSDAPAFVSIAPYRAFNPAAFGPGFLGPQHAPLTVGATDQIDPQAIAADGYARLQVDDLRPPANIEWEQWQRRVQIWRSLQQRFLSEHPVEAPLAQDTVYQRAMRLMGSEAAKAFDLSEEPEPVRQAYGPSRFGQGCLMARRLIERGVAFVEVSLGEIRDDALGWDTHRQNFPEVRRLSSELDAGWSMLMSELQDRGLLESTTILWMGEFGRTPQINAQAGRDHFPAAWTCVFAGGGIQGGQAYGATSPDGTEVVDGKVGVGDVLATLSAAVGVDPTIENVSNAGRPFKIAEGEVVDSLVRRS